MKHYDPMLIADGELPEGTNWLYQFKFDGIRCIAYVNSGTVKLVNRAGFDVTPGFPEVVKQLSHMRNCVLDGELFVGSKERPGGNFQVVLERSGVQSITTAALLAAKHPAIFIAFDLLETQGSTVTAMQFTDRYSLLHGLKVTHAPATPNADEAKRVALERGFEGLVARSRTAPYEEGERPESNIRWKPLDTSDLIVYGWEESPDSQIPVRSFLLGTQDGFGWRFVGKVGSGFSAEDLAGIMPDFIEINSKPPVANEPDFKYPVHYVQPSVVFEVSHLGYEDTGMLRNPSFIRRRKDKEMVSL